MVICIDINYLIMRELNDTLYGKIINRYNICVSSYLILTSKETLNITILYFCFTEMKDFTNSIIILLPVIFQNVCCVKGRLTLIL